MARKYIEATIGFKKDIGKIRISNDDECRIVLNSYKEVLMVLADGMGGQNKGDYASSTTVNFLCEEFLKKPKFITYIDAMIWIANKIKKINTLLYNTQDKDENYRGMGTTLVVALLVGNKIVVINIGDSRCYLVNNKKLVQITEDQTYVNYLYKSGIIEEKDMATNPNRHVLTNSLGCFPSVSFDKFIINYTGQSIFLCSDGLYNNVSIKDIEAILNTTDETHIKVDSLIELANYNGGSDNISCCLWEPIKK
ncbi:MAG: Stp1/IreP family PP2C-type Ser/Thr phosphatase [Candidatus Onthovivens sp.]|nr:Stp1/IreP family PP2C-type Ser/Thr phosphatase [Mollicutes bacterium]MDD7546288.1 Stp1/IreP family PP2C-type Ser/Thr phosphatase [Bacilli bacterium]MDY2723975.1 Stp1/IreP family PP2C-type Ser/Thr phosphatase [Candidatus Onthovivens sp.]MCI6615351.1 Stp1/IreP family PP2C-type Ser/Thr phosphatase [Mollicutes bacterium]MCI7040511.1 Stp1/IreP family PP2C-type Ser/Thr phosphatase [Mollicutes bacterium]